MRIIHICQRNDSATGGALRVAQALVKEQCARGLDVWILYLYCSPNEVSTQFAYGQRMCLGLKSSKSVLRGIPALRKQIRKLSPDIVHSHDGIVWPRIALLRIGIPIVMHAHLPAWKPHSILQKIGWALISKTTNLLIGISHPTINSWIEAKFSIAKIRYIPNGVDSARFHVVNMEEKVRLRRSLGLPESKRILLWVGQLNRSMKGTDRMEHVAARLPDNTILLVVGHGPEFSGIQRRCEGLLESGKMLMTGTVSKPEFYFMASDAFMFTSYHEPFGLVIVEAVACGLPVMAFPLLQGGGASDLLLEFQAVSVDDGVSEREIEIVLQKLASRKKELGEELSASARENYNWRTISDKVVDVYQSISGLQPLRVLACQHGARHRYAIPRMLESAGILVAFYTDSSRVSFLGRGVKILSLLGLLRKKNKARWASLGVSRNKVYSSDLNVVYEFFQALLFMQKEGIYLYRQRHHSLSVKMKKWGLRGANVVYSMYHENLDFIHWAKQQGAMSAIDVFVSPITDEIMAKEHEFFGDWSDADADGRARQLERELWKDTVEIADILICPSMWVAEGVLKINPMASEKIRIVPYGCSLDYKFETNTPKPGRVLFAGREALRKGLHYLAWAATRLKDDIPDLDVRVAGGMDPQIVNHPICTNLNFLGQLTSEQMKEEYLSADVLVLPALSEGFAGVVAEAIGAGCPVIVTYETGSPIVHEREGLIIPSRNVEALSDAIHRMVTDRNFRALCAANCLKQVPFYSEEQWQDRLITTLKDFIESNKENGIT